MRCLLLATVTVVAVDSCAKKEEVADLQTQINTLNENLQSAIQATQDELVRLEEALSQAATEAEVNAIRNEIDAINSKLRDLENIKAELQSLWSGVNYNSSRITELQNKLDEIMGKINIVVSAPGFDSKELVEIKYATWNADEQSEAFIALKKAFPELENYTKGEVNSIEGYANVIVNPASADATKYSFGFMDKFGKDIEDLYYTVASRGFNTRSANGFWKVGVNAFKGREKLFATEQGPFSLSVIAKDREDACYNTEFAYYVKATDCSNKNVEIVAQNAAQESAIALYAKSINVFEPVSEYLGLGPVVSISNGFKEYYTISLSNDAATKKAAEQYGITFEGNCIKVGTNPEKKTVKFRIDVTALGLNGSAASKTITIEMGNPVAGKMEDLSVVYDYLEYPIQVRWAINDMELSRSDLKALFACNWKYDLTSPAFDMTNADICFYDETGNEIKNASAEELLSKAVEYGFDIKSSLFAPYKADIALTIKNSDGEPVYADIAHVTVYGKIAGTEAFVDADYATWPVADFKPVTEWCDGFEGWKFKGDAVGGTSDAKFFDKDMKLTSTAKDIAFVGVAFTAKKSGNYSADLIAKDKDANEVFFRTNVWLTDSLAVPAVYNDTTSSVAQLYWTKEQLSELYSECLNAEHWYFDVVYPEDEDGESFSMGGTVSLVDKDFKTAESRSAAKYVTAPIVKYSMTTGTYKIKVYAQDGIVRKNTYTVYAVITVSADGKITIKAE